MKLIAGALITAVLLSGCGSKSSDSKSSDSKPSSVDILMIKQEACSMFNDTLNAVTPNGYNIAGMESTDLFDKLAKLDPQYITYAEYVALISLTDFKDQTSNGAGLIALAKVKVFCS
jgi:hypothetical protein